MIDISVKAGIAMQSTLLIINPVSGRRKIKPLLYKVVDLLCQHGCKTTIFITTGPLEATRIVKEYSHDFDRVICCGGDGTLNEIFTGLMETKSRLPVGYIPSGTTNDFANTLTLPKSIAKAALVALEGQIIDVDLGSFCTSKYFSYVASFGAFTNASYKTPQWLKNFLGRPSYFLYGVSSIIDIRPYEARIVADEREIEGEFIFGSVTNTTFLGGFKLFPVNFVGLDDGLFELLLVRAPKSPKDMQAIVDNMLKRSYNDKQVLLMKAKKISFTFTGSVPWTVDGEFAGDVSSAVIENLNKAVQITV